jgi:DNA-binding NarL/FixJ family response regulator
MGRPRVLLADDHTILLEGLKGLLEPDFDLVGTAENGSELLTAAEKLEPDVILLDISMPVLNGIEAARRLKEQNSKAKIVFLTMHADSRFVKEAFRVGASGYLLKRAASAELVSALREVLDGRFYVTPLITKDIMQSLLDPNFAGEDRTGQLTSRQREVLQLVAEGKSLKEIAAKLNLSTKTVEYHKRSIMDELGLRTTAELTRYAVKHGIVNL